MSNIKTNRRVEKNIKNNLKFYQNQDQATEVAYGMLEIIMIIALAICSAVVSIFGAINIIYRIPDFFRFEFDKLEVSKSLDLSIADSELGDFFSQFMLHSHDTFSLKAIYQGIERELFNSVEAGMMGNFRMLLDIFLILCVVALIVVVAVIFMLQFNRMSRQLRLSINIGLVVYIVTMVGIVVYFNVYSGDVALAAAFTDGKLVPDDLLGQMFEESFTLDSTVAIVVISFIIMMVIRYIVWQLTKQKGIFSEGLKGISK